MSSPVPKPQAKSKGKKTSRTAKKKRGWGPFQSVLKERSVDFNLTLDVQNLQQELRNLTTLRDLLSTGTTLRRHSPEGSLFHMVNEYFHVFRTGWAIHESDRKMLLGEQNQREFLHNVMDPEVDVDNGLRGPDVMVQQLIMYSTFIKYIRLTMTSYDIIVAEDTVVIQTNARLKFQILRSTIEEIFPHVIGDECLVAKLVGQEAEPMIAITFFFNSTGKCFKYKVDLDFVGAFARIVKDPQKLDILLGQALIAENSMFGMMTKPVKQQESRAAVGPRSTFESALVEEPDQLTEELRLLRNSTPATSYHTPPSLSSKPLPINNDAIFKRIVSDYYLIFENGYRRIDNQECVNDDFVSQIFVPNRAGDPQTGGKDVLKRWQILCEIFHVLEFRQTSALRVEYNDQEGICVVRSEASYALRITEHSLKSVFPHIMSDRSLTFMLLENTLVVQSKLVFSIESDTCLISRIDERMDFVEAMTALLGNQGDVSFVMSHALFALDGVNCESPTKFSGILSSLACYNSSRRSDASKSCTHNARSTTMTDILHE